MDGAAFLSFAAVSRQSERGYPLTVAVTVGTTMMLRQIARPPRDRFPLVAAQSAKGRAADAMRGRWSESPHEAISRLRSLEPAPYAHAVATVLITEIAREISFLARHHAVADDERKRAPASSATRDC